LTNQALGPCGRIVALEVVLADFLVGLAPRDDVINDHEQRMGQRHDRFLVPPPGGDPPIARHEGGVFRMRGRLRCLDEDGPYPDVALARAATALPSGTLVGCPAPDLPRRRARRLKEGLWQQVLAQVPHDAQFAIIDSFPLPVCQFARAPRCRRFRSEAAYGKDTLVRQTFYGLRVHVRLEWPGVITRCCIAAANVHELSALPALTEATQGTLVGDRNYWSPKIAAKWQQHGVDLLAPYRTAKRDPHPRWSARLSRVRYRIDTVFGQLVDRCAVKRLWARDLWHLSNRLLRKVLMHTLAVLFNVDLGNPPLHLARVVTT
jgi:hypothetical protein